MLKKLKFKINELWEIISYSYCSDSDAPKSIDFIKKSTGYRKELKMPEKSNEINDCYSLS